MHSCKICQEKFDYVRGFKLHLKKVHLLSNMDYVIMTEYDGKHPTCACGCGNETSWRQDAFFLKFIKGHVTDEFRDIQRKRRLGKKTSLETRIKQSFVAKKFWTSDVGKRRAKERAIALQKFYQSDAGKILRKIRSENLKTFNLTDEGKKIRKIGAEKQKKTLLENPQIIKNRSEKLKILWTSEKKDAARERLKAYYSSDSGVKLKKQIALKVRSKVLLKKDEFEERLNKAFTDLETSDKIPTYDHYSGYHETFNIDINIVCKKENHSQTRKLINILNIPKCLVCAGTLSKPQHDIAQFVQSLGFDVVQNDRKIIQPLELDVFVPERNFAIEFNGLYWHSELNRSNNFHVELKKTVTMERGVNLLTIFEDEWRDKRPIVESMIKHRLGINSTKIFARKLRLGLVDDVTKKQFFDENHLESDVRSQVCFGLFDSATLVAALSLRKPFHKSASARVEIARFSVLRGFSIVGGLSRLINKAIDWAKENGYFGLLTYVDSRIGNGSGYILSGFKFERLTGPRFWWTDFHVRYDRFKFKARDEMSEKDVAKNAGVHKIWGARNNVFVLDWLNC